MIRVALAAGGTAGHVYPAVAVAAELTRRGAEVIFLGTSSGRERELLQGHPYRLELLPGRPFYGTTRFGKARAVLTVPPALATSARVLRRERIDVVIGFGGYASVGPVLAARVRGIWSAILEPNAVLGMANRLLARVADRIYIGMITQCDSPKARRVGLPVRSEIPAACRTRASGNGRLRVLLFDETLTIDANGVDVRRACEAREIGPMFASCDLVIARAGAGTLAEISLCALPSILVPLRAAEDHQARNANVYAESGGAVVARSAEEMNARLHELIADDERRLALGQRAATLAAPNAARDLVDDVLQCTTR